MKKIFFLSVFSVLFGISCFSQKFDVLNQNTSYSFKKAPKEFYFISEDLNESKGVKIADMKFYARDKGEKISLVPVFSSLWKRANKLGANSFFVSEIEYDPNKTRYDITVELFFLNDDEIDENLSLYPKNLIVFIGNVNTTNEEKGRNFKLNNEDFTLYPFQYITYEYDDGEEIIVQIGGIMGSMGIGRGEDNRFPQFFSFGGASLTPAMVPVSPWRRELGFSFQTGTISKMDMNLGLFLMEVLNLEK